MAVDTPSEKYEELAEVRKLVATIMGGTKAMRKAGKKYLPQEPNESDKAYDVRLRRSTFFNAYKKAVRTLVGKPFSERVKTSGFTPNLELVLNDADLMGRSIHSFAKDIFFAAVTDGITFILVDYPTLEKPLSVAEIKKLNVRPYLVHVDCRRVIGWKYETVNGVQVLTEVRIREEAEVQDPEDEFNMVKVNRIRLIRQDSWELYEEQVNKESGKSEYTKIQEGVLSIGKVPLVAVYTNRTDFFVGEPPLEDLADLNIEHWQSRSDQSTILHVARVPILFAAGVPGDESGEFTVGPNSVTRVDNPAAHMGYVEHSGEAIGAGREDIQDIEHRMKVLGMEPLIKNQIQTATEKSYDRDDFDCELSQMVWSLQDALDEALDICALWFGEKTNDGVLEIFSDFAIDLSSVTDLEYLFRARQQGDLSQRVYLGELQRRKVLSDTVDIEDVINETEISGGPLGKLNNTGGASGNANLPAQ